MIKPIDEILVDLETVANHSASFDRERLLLAGLELLAVKANQPTDGQHCLASHRLALAASHSRQDTQQAFRRLREIAAIRGWSENPVNPADVRGHGSGWGTVLDRNVRADCDAIDELFLERATGLGPRSPH